jgi:ferrous iron transport protein B
LTTVPSIAVIGNPNTGKTTLFNALTGLRQRVGNYPGVTVERKTGVCRLDDQTTVELIDLPGTYSLAARSPDEVVAVDVLLGQQQGTSQVDAVLAIADASNPERNFYLISQLCELGLPVVIALNMMDLAESRGIEIDVERLQAALGTPVIPLCASRGEGVEQLRAALKQALVRKAAPACARPQFSAVLLAEADALCADMRARSAVLKRSATPTEAFRVLVDKGGFAETRVCAVLGETFRQELEARRQRVSVNPLTAEEVRVRYAWVKQTLADVLKRPAVPPPEASDRVDRVLTHWFWGTLIFAAMMALVFQMIFSWTEPLMKSVDGVFHFLGGAVTAHLAPGALQSLLADGVIAGVGSILCFLPQICMLFFFLAVLEDCGYMARAAFLMDRLLSRVGLSGKAFIPMLSSFGCGVPGVMATRTIDDPRERLTTILIVPLMSCSARLPVYYLLITAFVPEQHFFGGWVSLRGLSLLAMYCVGIAIAVPVAFLLNRLVFRGAGSSFLIELPSYQLPQWRSVLLRIFLRAREFLVRAGTIILAVNIIVWALAYFPHSEQIAESYQAQRAAIEVGADVPGSERAEQLASLDREEAGEYLRQSYFGKMGHALEGVFKPLGWDWRISMAALASFPAREVIVATMGTIFNVSGDAAQEPESLRKAMRQATWEGSDRKLFTIPVAFSIMVFFALCSQCGATLAVIKRETNSWRWPLFSFSYMTALAYVMALLVYQGMTAMGI